MASYVPVTNTDENFPLLQALADKARKYVVTWKYAVTNARAVFNIVKSMRLGFQACRDALRRGPASAPLCFLIQGAAYFRVVADNEFTH